jgi:predicted DNA-binding ribbon-helix-helix protein
VTEKRSVSLAGHRTSVALEPAFWAAVERIAAARGLSLAAFVAQVDRQRKGKNLASALRLAVLADLESRLAEDGAPAPHGRSPTLAVGAWG